MNTELPDASVQKLTAQIGEALFDQPGMTLMDVANRLRQLLGNAGPLLCGSCYGLGVIGYTSGQTPEQFEQGEYPCPDCSQPSPAGQGDVPYDVARDLLADAYNAGRNGIGFSEQVMRLGDALAARQPMCATVKDSLTVGGGQPVAWMTHHVEPMLFPTREEASDYCEDGELPIPLYTAPPAQAVDLAENLLSVLIEEGVLSRNGRVFKKLRTLTDSGKAVQS